MLIILDIPLGQKKCNTLSEYPVVCDRYPFELFEDYRYAESQGF